MNLNLDLKHCVNEKKSPKVRLPAVLVKAFSELTIDRNAVVLSLFIWCRGKRKEVLPYIHAGVTAGFRVLTAGSRPYALYTNTTRFFLCHNVCYSCHICLGLVFVLSKEQSVLRSLRDRVNVAMYCRAEEIINVNVSQLILSTSLSFKLCNLQHRK